MTIGLCLFLLPAQEGPVVWVIPSLERVGLSDPAGNVTLAPLWAARGEYESFQIVVRAPENHRLTNVNVAASMWVCFPGSNVLWWMSYLS